MDIDFLVKIANIVGPLLQGVCWPLVALAIFLYFRRTLKEVIGDARMFSVKAGMSGIEATVERRVIEASAYLGAAEASRSGDASDARQREPDGVYGVADVVRAITPQAVQRLSVAHLLWVDDRPENNIYERKSLEALGVQIHIATSTDEALIAVRQSRFDVIITDMGRPPDSRAGYTLLARLREAKIEIPVIIYAGSNRPEHRAQAREHGALGSTNDPFELFQLVIDAIMGGQIRR